MSDEFDDGFTIHNIEDYDAEPDSKLGKLVPPFPVELCANSTCQQTLDQEKSDGAYMFRDLTSGKIVIFCGHCAPGIELNHRDRFLLIPL